MNCGFPGLQLPAAPLPACDTAKVLAALTGLEPLNRNPLEISVKSKDTAKLSRSYTPAIPQHYRLGESAITHP